MKHIKIFEQFDDDDPFGEESGFGFGSDDLSVGDEVEFGHDGAKFWENRHHTGTFPSMGNKDGYWDISSGKSSGKKIISGIDYCEDVKGYTGKIVTLEYPYYPWFQAINMRKK